MRSSDEEVGMAGELCDLVETRFLKEVSCDA